MSNGRCCRHIGYILLVLSLLCMLGNILLYFPFGERIRYSLNPYVGYLHGIVGGGVLVMIPALVFIGLEHQHFHDCCPREHHRRHCALLATVLLACVGVCGAGYCFCISAIALANEPHCFHTDDTTGCQHSVDSARGFHHNHSGSCHCHDPTEISTWNICLFSITLCLSGIELILCCIQVIKGCIGGAWAVCHSDREKKNPSQSYKLLICGGKYCMPLRPDANHNYKNMPLLKRSGFKTD